MHVLAYDRFKRLLGVTSPTNRMSSFMSNALVEPEVLLAMGGDFILSASELCPSPFWGPPARGRWKKETLWGLPMQVSNAWQFRHTADGTVWWDDIHWKCPPGAYYFDEYAVPVDENPNPSPDDYHPACDYPDEYLRELEESSRWLYENTPFALSCGEMTTDLQLTPGGKANWWMRLVTDPTAVHEFLGKATEAALSQLRLLEQAIGSYTEIMQVADDIGDSRGVTIGPDLWREIYKPYYQRWFSGWHEITNMKINLHCCGSVSAILDDLIECGVDIYNPVQISGRGMDPALLESRFGDRLIFYGGAYDAIQTPPNTPEAEVYRQVKANITALNRRGRYIFTAVHNIPGNTPEGHLRAILAAYRDCCG